MSIIFKISKYLKKNIKPIISILCTLSVCLGAFCPLNAMAYEYKDQAIEQQLLAEETQKQNEVVEKQNAELLQQLEEYQKTIAEQEAAIEELNNTIQEMDNEVESIDPAKVSTNNSSTVKEESPKSESVPQPSESGNGYEQSAKVWNHLKSMGLNDYVCAGIMGNIMAEVGGHTLDISRWSTYSGGSYYGICQWGGSRKTRLLNNYGSSLDAQLSFLSVELYEVIPVGSSFYSMTNEREVALYFAKHFERCSSQYYSIRQSNASKPLDYFN